jgi:hypothetical protein
VIGWNGSELAVVYMHGSAIGDYDYEIARASETGVVMGAPVQITMGAAVQHPPHIAWAGDRYGIAWSGGGDIYFRHFSADGASTGPVNRLTTGASPESWASVAWSPATSRFGVAWSQGSMAADNSTLFIELDSNGAILSGTVEIAATPGVSDTTQMVWAGTAFAAAWHELGGAEVHSYLAILDAGGRDTDGVTRIDSGTGAAFAPNMAWNGTRIGITWTDQRDGNDEVYFATADLSGAVGPNVRLSAIPGRSTRPHITASGTEFAVTWYDVMGMTSQVMLQRIAGDGTPLGMPRVLTCAVAPVQAAVPAITWTGSRYGVAYLELEGSTTRVRVLTVAP